MAYKKIEVQEEVKLESRIVKKKVHSYFADGECFLSIGNKNFSNSIDWLKKLFKSRAYHNPSACGNARIYCERTNKNVWFYQAGNEHNHYIELYNGIQYHFTAEELADLFGIKNYK